MSDRLARPVPEPEGQPLHVLGGQRLWCEVPVVGASGKRDVHLGRTAGEMGGSVEIDSNGVGCLGGESLIGQSHERKPACCKEIRGNLRRCAVLEVAGKLLQRPDPAIALVVDHFLQHTQGGHFPAIRLEEDHAAEFGNVLEAALLAQIPGDFTVGIGANLDVAKEFQDQLVSVADGGVALLCTASLRSQRHVFVATQVCVELPRGSAQEPHRKIETLVARDGGLQPLAEVVVESGIADRPLAVPARRENGFRVFLGNRLYALGIQPHERHGVHVRSSIGVVNIDQHPYRITIGDGCPGANGCGVYGSRLATEPALAREKGGNFAVEFGPLGPSHDAFPIGEHKSLITAGRRHCAEHIGDKDGLQFEPKVSVGPQG